MARLKFDARPAWGSAEQAPARLRLAQEREAAWAAKASSSPPEPDLPVGAEMGLGTDGDALDPAG